MKKYLFTFIAISFLLTGCSQTKAQEVVVNNPYEVYSEEILSYYDKKEDITINNFNVLENSFENYQNKSSNNILINSDGIIRCISIIDETIITYKNISVGDSIEVIKSAFEKEYQANKTYVVTFNNNQEEDPTSQNREDSWIFINYVTNGETITQIVIFDNKYGRELR